MRVLVTGATGFIGRALLERYPEAAALSRSPKRARNVFPASVSVHAWDAVHEPAPAAAFEGVEVVFHLTGESLWRGRWTAAKKKRIWESRIETTRNLVRALGRLSARPRVLVSASAVGYYGSRGDDVLDESEPPGDDFLAQLGKAWEEEALRAREHGLRVVTPRTALIFGRGGGALGPLVPLFRLGLGGRLAGGRQWMSWIHLDDGVGLLAHAAEHDSVEGALNAGSPNPVRNREFTATLARLLGRPAPIPVPAWALRLALGEFADALLASQRMVPAVAEHTGYRFRHPGLEGALADVLGVRPGASG